MKDTPQESPLEEMRRLQRRTGMQCGFKSIYETLDKETAEAIDQAHKEGIYSTSIARYLRNKGYVISDSQTQYHFRGDCQCRR